MPVMSRFVLEFSNPSELHLESELVSYLHNVRGVVQVNEEENPSRRTLTLSVDFRGQLDLDAFRELLALSTVPGRVDRPFIDTSWVNTPAFHSMASPSLEPNWWAPTPAPRGRTNLSREIVQDMDSYHSDTERVGEVMRLIDMGVVSMGSAIQNYLGLGELDVPPQAPHLTRFDLIG